MADGDDKTGEDPKKKLHWAAYVFYYTVLFFAVWFDASHFDQDGDGDFDAEDVQFWLAKQGLLDDKYKITLSEKRAAKKRAKIRQQILAKREAEKKKAQEEAAARGEHNWLDRDGDGDVDVDDLINSQVEGEAQELKAMEEMMKGKAYPWFIIFECVAVLTLWLVMAIIMSNKYSTSILDTQGGLNSIVEGMFDLRLYGTACEDYRAQIWRWLSYQFTHVGASHVCMNVFLNFMLGIPLEGMHGWWRLALMFNVGVFGGACCYMWADAHTAVVGCSGGCYALIGIHIADIIMNWHQKKFRLPTVFMIFTLVAIDVLTYAFSTDDGSKSHAAHVGGAIAGLIIGVLVCKNETVKTYERVIAVGLGILGCILMGFSLGWMGAQHDGPLNIFEAASGEKGWCWFRQVFDRSFGLDYWVCIRCGTQECINTWSNQKYIMEVDASECATRGFYYDGR